MDYRSEAAGTTVQGSVHTKGGGYVDVSHEGMDVSLNTELIGYNHSITNKNGISWNDGPTPIQEFEFDGRFGGGGVGKVAEGSGAGFNGGATFNLKTLDFDAASGPNGALDAEASVDWSAGIGKGKNYWDSDFKVESAVIWGWKETWEYSKNLINNWR
jgi:hypothetical protein